MRITYLLDTNVIAELIRPKPNPHVMQKLAIHQHDIGIPIIVWHEILFGLHRLPPSQRKRMVEAQVQGMVQSNVPIVLYGRDSADYHAQERARQTTIGRTPPLADSQIAAIAYSHNLTLVTANTKDFALFNGLKIANWHTP